MFRHSTAAVRLQKLAAAIHQEIDLIVCGPDGPKPLAQITPTPETADAATFAPFTKTAPRRSSRGVEGRVRCVPSARGTAMAGMACYSVRQMAAQPKQPQANSANGAARERITRVPASLQSRPDGRARRIWRRRAAATQPTRWKPRGRRGLHVPTRRRTQHGRGCWLLPPARRRKIARGSSRRRPGRVRLVLGIPRTVGSAGRPRRNAADVLRSSS